MMDKAFITLKGWESTTLGEVINFRRGHDLPIIKILAGKYPVVGSSGVIGYHNTFTTKNPCISVGRSGNSAGKILITKDDCWAHNTTLYIDDFKGNMPEYVFYFLKTLNLASYRGGSAVPTLNRNHLHPIDVVIPPLPQQKAIAHILGSLDDKIELNRQMNKTLEQMAQAMFKSWFVDDSNYETIELGNVIQTTSGGTPSRKKMEYYEDGIFNWVKSKELNSSFVITTEESITKDALNNSSAKMLPKNSILIAMYGATVGEYALIDRQMTCNQAICALIANEKYPYPFLFMFMKNVKDKLINLAVGSAQQNISQIIIKQLLLPKNSDKIILYGKTVEPYFNKIKQNLFEIETLTKLRDTLLPKLVGGEVRVLN